MNVSSSLIASLGLLIALTGCIQEADGGLASTDTDVPADADTDTDTDTDTDADSDADTDTDTDTDTDVPTETDSDDAYTYSVTERTLEIDGAYNPYKGYTIGMFCDGCGTEDGWSRAVATIPPSEDGSITVDLGLFGNGADIRWSLALIDANLAPTQWIWESGVVSGNLVENDPLGLTMTVQECVGEQMVDKIDLCTQITDDGIMSGSCWGTYVPPADCTDADNDGDVDPDAGDDSDEDTGTDTDTDCAGDCAVDDDGDGYSENAGDCDDGWPGTNPGHSSEWEDDQDNDCDGLIDEDCESDDTWNQFCD